MIGSRARPGGAVDERLLGSRELPLNAVELAISPGQGPLLPVEILAKPGQLRVQRNSFGPGLCRCTPLVPKRQRRDDEGTGQRLQFGQGHYFSEEHSQCGQGAELMSRQPGVHGEAGQSERSCLLGAFQNGGGAQRRAAQSLDGGRTR